jgi:hypothetical protein
MVKPIILDVEQKANVIIAKDGEHIQQLALDLANKVERYGNADKSKLYCSVFIVPSHLITARMSQSNTNRCFIRIIHIYRHLDCQIIILKDTEDRIDSRIVKYLGGD